MNDRFKIALKEGNLSTQEVADAIGLKANTLRKAINRNSINDGYLILIEQTCGISKKWLKEGIKPVIVNKVDTLLPFFEEDLLQALESVDKDKIVAYILLKEKEFLKLPSFNALIDKLKVSQRISNIVKDT
ncbi:helix-turn-helix domain-containing protein [Kordia sp.]|uniref:helix-turn-helix domain-containing protein n=1 Tax=Kordia sp. TaxID=1965332 RepID=UPI003D2C03F8